MPQLRLLRRLPGEGTVLQSREARRQTSAAAAPLLVDQAKRAALGSPYLTAFQQARSASLAPQMALDAAALRSPLAALSPME